MYVQYGKVVMDGGSEATIPIGKDGDAVFYRWFSSLIDRGVVTGVAIHS